MVKFISPKDVLPLRSEVLRSGLALELCIFPTDEIEGAFHLGCFAGEKIISVASFLQSEQFKSFGRGFQLRGMASDPLYAGKGYGSELVRFACEHLRHKGIDYIWCNARLKAVPFYERLGFEVESPEFEIAGIGPHYEMKLNLK